MAKKYFVTITAEVEVDPEFIDEKGNFTGGYEVFTSLDKYGCGISYGDEVEVIDEHED